MPGTSNRRIAKNTIILFIRMFIVMSINLFTVRLTLQALGVEDYGIYNVVFGFVTMFACISNVLSAATQRYYSFYLGVSDVDNLKRIYSASLIIYLTFSGIILLIGETVGLWFVNTQLVIPEARMAAANYLYQFAILTFIISILVVPFSAAVIAHEHFDFFAIVSLVDCILRFLLVLTLKFLSPDKLVLYGLFLLFVQCVIFGLYYLFCRKKYLECHLVKVENKQTYKDLISFSGWTLFGSVAGMGMMQVNTILVNIFFGPIVNAARAISIQVHTAIMHLSGNFIMSVRPPMIKNYADGNFKELNYLFSLSNKIIFLLMSICCVPLFYEMPFVLKVWLGEVSQDTVVFSRLMVIYTFFLTFNNPITIIMQAMGRVKEYFVPVELITLLCAPITYILFKLGFPADTTFKAMIFCILGSHVVRVRQLKKYYPDFNLKNYLKDVVLFPVITLVSIHIIITQIIKFVENPWVELFAVVLISSCLVVILTYFIGMSRSERKSVINILRKKQY